MFDTFVGHHISLYVSFQLPHGGVFRPLPLHLSSFCLSVCL